MLVECCEPPAHSTGHEKHASLLPELSGDRRLWPPDLIRMLSAAKDKLTSSAAKSYVNELIKSYGRLEEFSIDSRARRIELRCRLDGEPELLGVCIEEYQVERRDGKVFARIIACTASRPWLQGALRAHLLGRPLEVPPWVAAAL